MEGLLVKQTSYLVYHIYPKYSDSYATVISADTDKMLQNAASYLCLHYLPFNHHFHIKPFRYYLAAELMECSNLKSMVRS